MTDVPKPSVGRWLFSPGGEDTASSAHLSDEDLAILLEEPSTALSVTAFREHLAACDECRHATVQQRQDLAGAEPPSSLPDVPARLQRQAAELTAAPHRGRAGARPAGLRAIPALSVLAVVLVVAGVALMIPFDRLGPATGGAARSPAEGAGTELVGPSGMLEPGAPLVFEWTPVEGASRYEVVVGDPAAGAEIVLRVSTRQTRHELTDAEAAMLERGKDYQWFVRVERGVGRTATTIPLTFRLAPETGPPTSP